MNDIITVSGVVATDPRHLVTDEGLSVTSFRLVTSSIADQGDARARPRTSSNWYTVTAYRQLASNVAGCVSRGDPLLVSGRLRVREWSDDEEEGDCGVCAEIEADALGHDLGWGSAAFVRTVDVSSATAA
ncbi:single-stranded DNA-binding protein [Leifsonia sp. NPDC102414]|uniref:single-stranded DNA-binding protein n=1 Tax=Leifsonia sp. NPDC102414 TaxID=3364124 RepID=UPI0038256E04